MWGRILSDRRLPAMTERARALRARSAETCFSIRRKRLRILSANTIAFRHGLSTLAQVVAPCACRDATSYTYAGNGIVRSLMLHFGPIAIGDTARRAIDGDAKLLRFCCNVDVRADEQEPPSASSTMHPAADAAVWGPPRGRVFIRCGIPAPISRPHTLRENLQATSTPFSRKFKNCRPYRRPTLPHTESARNIDISGRKTGPFRTYTLQISISPYNAVLLDCRLRPLSTRCEKP